MDVFGPWKEDIDLGDSGGDIPLCKNSLRVSMGAALDSGLH